MPTTRRWRHRLPHWEVEGKAYFITIRCAGSLPVEVRERIHEIKNALSEVEARTEQFAQLQRKYFLTAEKYLDQSTGFAPFRDPGACELCLQAFQKIEEDGWVIPEAVIMPNHVHLVCRANTTSLSLKELMKRFKGRSARAINQHLNRSGHFWQEDWFDRWIRNEQEFEKIVHYVRENPVKAGMVKCVDDLRWYYQSGKVR